MQMGDFFDLWREFPWRARPDKIPDESHGELRDVLYRGVFRGLPCLKATMILGNHDTKNGKPLPEIPFQLKAFNRTTNDRPFLFASHGDAFSVVETKVPDPIREIAVHLIGKLTPTNTYSVARWSDLAEEQNKPARQMTQCIVAKKHTLETKSAPLVTPGGSLPARLLRKLTQPTEQSRFHEFYASLQIAKQVAPSAQGIRVFALGHSHRANIVLYEPPGKEPMVMLDTGAWIENCEYQVDGGAISVEPNAQLSVIHGNDIRIYQVSFPALRVPS
jgi:hypothetical protein